MFNKIVLENSSNLPEEQSKGKYVKNLIEQTAKKINYFTVSTLGLKSFKLVIYYSNLAGNRTHFKGKRETVKFLKSCYDVSLRYSSGLEYNPIPFTKTNKNGFPKVLRPFEDLLLGSPNEIRTALTVLQLYKLISTPGPASFESITNEYSGSDSPTWLPAFEEVLENYFPQEELEHRLKQISGNNVAISGSTGPNGKAILTAHVDRKALCGTLLEQAIEQVYNITHNTIALDLFKDSEQICSEEFKNKKEEPCHSRIRVKHESGGKDRPFCILDIFTQSCFKSLHVFCMSFLEKLDQDGANDHGRAAKAVCEWTKGIFPIWSFDLTTATDRFPIFIQEIVVGKMFGKEYATLWRTIMTDREFLTPEGDRYVRFNAGQPLGALSSWAVFAISHHMLIQTANKLNGNVSDFKSYRIIGDDIAIHAHRANAEKYISMMEELAVPFSEVKSVLPSSVVKVLYRNRKNQVQLSNPQFKPEKGFIVVAELAKRLFVNGIELTPVPPKEILENISDPIGKGNLLRSTLERGYHLMSNPHHLQAAFLITKKDYAVATFPLGSNARPIKGVKHIFEFNRKHQDGFNIVPTHGLKPVWNFWEDANHFRLAPYQFSWLLRIFVRKEVDSAILQANDYQYKLRKQLDSPEGLMDNSWAWQPKDLGIMLKLQDRILTEMCKNFSMGMIHFHFEDGLDDQSLSNILNKLRTVLKPSDILENRWKPKERIVKRSTNKLTKTLLNIRQNGEKSFWTYIGY